MKAKYIHPKTSNDIFNQASMLCCIAFATVLRDKFGFGAEGTNKAIREVNYLTDSLLKGYVSFDDLEKELKKDGIGFR